MGKYLRLFSIMMVLMLSLVGAANATYINPVSGDGDGKNLQDVLNNITVGHISSVDALSTASSPQNDALAFDSYWSITGSSKSALAFVVEIAGNANTNIFGIYDAGNSSNKVQVFDGTAGAGYTASVYFTATGKLFYEYSYVDEHDNIISGNGLSSSSFAGNNFGYYIGVLNSDNKSYTYYYSDSNLNNDQFDHLVAFQGNNKDYLTMPSSAFSGLWTDNEYILAWEDQGLSGDRDYQDMVIMVESVQPVPEPSSLLLLGCGLIGLGVTGYRKIRK